MFDAISPVDYRYVHAECRRFLSENAFTQYKLKVELALLRALVHFKLCPQSVYDEVMEASKRVTTEEVYAEEGKIGHDIKALVNCLRSKVSEDAKRFVHMTATSFDISDSANAARFKDFVNIALYPQLKKFMRVLITLAKQQANTLQIGRTHGQHAVPITLGFTFSAYIARLGPCMENVFVRATELEGKFSGAVGSYNASGLFLSDPEVFEAKVLGYLNIKPAQQSSQIVPPESLVRLLQELMILAGLMGNIADDMRNLSRTEIREVVEKFKKNQVGSSTMPQKRNPFNFENVKSLFKVLLGRMTTFYVDLISDHQRDLTNSASARTTAEFFVYIYEMVTRLTKTLEGIVISPENLAKNVALQQGSVLAEPAQLVLASLGHPDAHEVVRVLTLLSEEQSVSIQELMWKDPDLIPYLQRLTPQQQEILKDPTKYTGIAAKKALDVAQYWEQRLIV